MSRYSLRGKSIGVSEYKVLDTTRGVFRKPNAPLRDVQVIRVNAGSTGVWMTTDKSRDIIALTRKGYAKLNRL